MWWLWWSAVPSDLTSLCNRPVNNGGYRHSHLVNGGFSRVNEQEKKKKRLSTLCEQEHLLCLVKYLQQRGGRGSGGGGGQWTASDLFWSANNLSEDKVADPPMLGSLLLEGIWSCFSLSGGGGERRGGVIAFFKTDFLFPVECMNFCIPF